ncbi:MAG: 2-oxoacid:ferredoxin oxidoreductase subunit beta [Anaerolineae bacterium]|nr:2-oxoacid:ferredoxin oxidoreductase subunit beta [Anaerolineae bacterium]
MANLVAQDYKSKVKPTWCPGCGDYGLLAALYQALARLQLDPARTMIVSGIGCSSRLPFFVKTYGFQTAHGRVLPVAMGVKIANPGLTVIAVGGDGDGFSIGGGHLVHAVRRNPDITYVVMDNQIYGLTKGQTSPTSPLGIKTKSTPFGSADAPINPMAWVLASGVSFAARGFSGDPKLLIDLIAAAVQHRGFAFIQAMSPCPTFNNTYDLWRGKVESLPADHNPEDRLEALAQAIRQDAIPLGVFYREARPTLESHTRVTDHPAKGQAGAGFDVRGLLESYR